VVDVALGVVEVMTGFRINTTYSTHHFGGEQDVFVVDYVQQQVDTFLVINTGVEEHVVHQQFIQRWQFQHVSQTTETAPVVRYGTATMGNNEFNGGEVLAHSALHQLHES